MCIHATHHTMYDIIILFWCTIMNMKIYTKHAQKIIVYIYIYTKHVEHALNINYT
jgi:hypothetical protein